MRTNAIRIAIGAWAAISTAVFIGLDMCYFQNRQADSPAINWSHTGIGLAAQLAHVSMAVFAAAMWDSYPRARKALLWVSLLGLFSWSPIRHGMLRGDEANAIFRSDPCLCIGVP